MTSDSLLSFKEDLWVEIDERVQKSVLNQKCPLSIFVINYALENIKLENVHIEDQQIRKIRKN